ncbi:MAG: hypothetical protein EBU66_09935 [Bacteroidetes bacterium]|nr:hypothetical protein [Bacteroidota bacterium]
MGFVTWFSRSSVVLLLLLPLPLPLLLPLPLPLLLPLPLPLPLVPPFCKPTMLQNILFVSSGDCGVGNTYSDPIF